MKSDYINRTILEEIENKIKGIKRTRVNRINASERLYKYDRKWDSIFFIMNIEAVILLISSLVVTSADNNQLIVSGVFSLYVVILQYYRSILNYRERGLKLHYQQIELEKYIVDFKNLLLKKNSLSNEELTLRYYNVMNLYLTSLIATENHSKLDDRINISNNSQKYNLPKKEEGSIGEDKHISFHAHYDFSVDNILINSNYIISIIVLMYIMLKIFF